ncbi:hypothetical protein HMPREF9134_00432 [Porphyromonas catoniae F0037]|uniref:Uncharacterized protein n=1 Tax=Porphyromonas catoniae F0037 TaxID=1127696 RepID=L1NGX2_9PORP|nr:hypothetical protein HMPREF9134_00432 [Porphyromonas catoniae F0037]
MSLHEEVKQEGGKGDMKERQKATQVQPPSRLPAHDNTMCFTHLSPTLASSNR